MPASTWEAVLSHIRDPADADRLADSAESRLLYRYAIPLYRHAADAGDGYAARQLAGLLAKRGDLDGLRARADAGDADAAGELVELLGERGDLDGLRARADAGDPDAARELVRLLAHGDLDGAAQTCGHAPADMPPGSWPVLYKRGDLDGAHRSCGPGPTPATRRPPGSWSGCWRGAATWTELRAQADAGDQHAARQLAELLNERGNLDALYVRADTGNWEATRLLSGLLAERGDLDEAEQERCAPGLTPATGMPRC